MGLAASQARFLCITARKANCEYKSTALAQEKLNITEQMSQISNDYAQAMNATKLIWTPDGMEHDYGLTYSLLMTPSAANDYDPYLVTSPSGAIVLNTAYMEAAKAAGISKAGGVPTAAQRDKFISALSAQGLVTEETAKAITSTDYIATLNSDNSVLLTEAVSDANRVGYNARMGMGEEPLVKGGSDAMTISDLILSDSIGKRKVDWAQLLLASTGEAGENKGKTILTALEVAEEKERLKNLQKELSTTHTAKVDDENVTIYNITPDIINQLTEDKNNTTDKTKQQTLQNLIEHAQIINNDEILKDSNRAKWYQEIKEQIAKDYQDYVTFTSSKDLVTIVNASDGLNVSANDLDYAENGNKKFNVVVNGSICHREYDLNNMTLGDILSRDVVLTAGRGGFKNNTIDAKEFSQNVLNLFNSMAVILGYSENGVITNQGLSVDESSVKALQFAYSMTKNIFLNSSKVETGGSGNNDSSMTDNGAYLNATTYNRIGQVGDHIAVSLSGMMSAFLTYYENALSGADSQYVVGKSVETSKFVTDNVKYVYIANELTEDIPMDQKTAYFFDEIYNNIMEHGWRYDVSLDDNEYFEAAIKDGRYSLASLNQDGYYYQTRYNQTGYMEEIPDTDAIARAEAEFAAKKAELTYKEDNIEMKTKQLDAEIASLATEIDSVKNFITKNIEKTFTMFSN